MMTLLTSTLLLWLAFIAAARLKERHDAKHYTGLRKWLGYGYVWLFLIGDIFYNYTFGTVLFLDFPMGRFTLTARLKHYLRTQPDQWRGKLAYFMCARMIEPWDQGHCGL